MAIGMIIVGVLFLMGMVIAIKEDEDTGGILCLVMGFILLCGGVAMNSNDAIEANAIEIGVGEYYVEDNEKRFRYKPFVQDMIDASNKKKLEEKKKNLSEQIEKMNKKTEKK